MRMRHKFSQVSALYVLCQEAIQKTFEIVTELLAPVHPACHRVPLVERLDSHVFYVLLALFALERRVDLAPHYHTQIVIVELKLLVPERLPECTHERHAAPTVPHTHTHTHTHTHMRT